MANYFAALSSPGYRLFWFGSLASVGATQLIMMGQSWLVFELSGIPLDLAILGAAGSIPTIIVTLAGGVVADRFDRRQILLITTPLGVALFALLTWLDFTNQALVWHVWLIAALFAGISGIDWPARQSIYTALISRDQMTSAIALNSVLWQGTRMIMPGLGGLIVAAYSTAAVFAVSTLGFVWMWVAMARLRVAPTARSGGNSWHQFTEGLKYVTSTPLFAILIPLTYITMFFGTSYLQIMPLFADLLGVGAQGFGLLLSASGVGSIAGTIVTGALAGSNRLTALMLAGAAASAFTQLLFCGLCLWLTGESWSFPLAAALVALTAAFASLFLITSLTVLQLRVPEQLRGRVMSLHGITFSLIALGALFSGGVAEFIGAPIAVAIGAAIVVLAVIVVAGKYLHLLDDTH